LTARGRRRVERIHRLARNQVGEALALLSENERATVVQGMGLYAKALERRRAQATFHIRPIRRADDAAVARLIRTVMPEFGASGPGFAIHDPEVKAMSSAYQGTRARYYVVERAGDLVGGGGFAPLEGGEDQTCELRKMYFLQQARGAGVGRKLLVRLLDEAARAGFKRCYLETLERMTQARRLYESVGFEPLCAPMGATGHHGCDRWYALELD
jgi:putative acetyltransferase